jgi:hypothetical protein
MFLYIPSKTNYNSLFKKDPLPGSKKTLTIIYLNKGGKQIEVKFLERRQVVIDDLDKLISSFYGFDSNRIDVSEIIRSKLTLKRTPNIKIDKPPQVKILLWKPSGGLGHCLHNLAWSYNFCLMNQSKLYIYGLENHIPYQETFHTTLEFIDKRVPVEEVTNIRGFFKKYNIDEKYYNLVNNARYDTNMKYMSKDCSIALMCGTNGNSVKNLIRFKNNYVSNILANPYKFFKNNYQLVSSIKAKNENTILTFHISGSYVQQLSVTNKMLGITEKDKNHFNKPKTLELIYINKEGKRIVYSMKERSEHTLTGIKEIVSCSYGILEKKRDVTKTIRNKFCKVVEESSNSVNVNERKLVEDIIKSKNYIAVHYRGRDKTARGGMNKKLSEILEAYEKTKITNVFIATDCPKFFTFLSDKAQNLTFIRYTSPPEVGINIHYNTTDFKKGENLYKTLLDIYTCKNSKIFIPSVGSGFSSMVNQL